MRRIPDAQVTKEIPFEGNSSFVSPLGAPRTHAAVPTERVTLIAETRAGEARANPPLNIIIGLGRRLTVLNNGRFVVNQCVAKCDQVG